MISLNAFYFLFGLKGLFFGAFYPLWPNLLLQNGFGTSEIAKIFGAQTAVSLLFNVPSGVLADRYGHKLVSLLGIALIFVGAMVPAFTEFNLNSILIGTVTIALGDTFASGALQSWLKDVQERRNGITITTHTILSRDQFERIGMISGAFVLIPFIVWSTKACPLGTNRTPWAILAAVGLLFFVWAYRLKAAPVEIHEEKTSFTFKTLANPKLRRIFVSSLIYGLANAVLGTVFWPKLNSLVAVGLSVASVQGILSLTRIAGISLWKRSGFGSRSWALTACLVLSGACLGVFSMAEAGWLAVGTWLLMALVLSLHTSALEGAILGASGREKATALSMAAAIQGVGTLASARWIEAMTKQGENFTLVCVAGAISLALAGLALSPIRRAALHSR